MKTLVPERPLQVKNLYSGFRATVTEPLSRNIGPPSFSVSPP